MSDERLFSESEVAELVRRASELQEEGSSDGYVPGLTQSELIKMVAEAGIKPEFLKRAIQERLDVKPGKLKFKLNDEVEKVIPVEIDPKDFDMITDAIKLTQPISVHGVQSGGVSQVGRSLQGQASGTWENPRFLLSSRGGRTKIKVWSGNGTATGLSMLWLIPLIFSIAAGKFGGPIAGVSMALACVVGSVLSFRWLVVKGQQTAREVASALERAVLDSQSELRQNLNSRTDQTRLSEDPATLENKA